MAALGPYLDVVTASPPAGAVTSLAPRQRRALERVAAIGFPTPRQEAWRFLDLAGLLGGAFAPTPGPGALDAATRAAVADAVAAFPGDLGGPRLLFVDGHLAPGPSPALPAGVTLASWARAGGGTGAVGAGLELDADVGEAFVALNAALTADGALVAVPAGVAVEPPLVVVHVATGGRAAHPRALVTLAPGARACLVEVFLSLGPAATFTNAVTEVQLGAGAALEHYRVVGGGAAYQVGRVAWRVGPGASLAAHGVTLGGTLQRHDLRVELAAAAQVSLGGLYLAAGDEQVDHHTFVDHAAPGGRSRELFKGILDGRAHAVFDGAVLVRPDAQQTDAVVANHNLLLSETASVNAKPQFNINADDVKCTHGATVGQLREDELFYLRSRGLELDAARALLLQGFAREALAGITLDPLRQALDRLIVEWLPRRGRPEVAA